MKKLLFPLLTALFTLNSPLMAVAETDTRCFEMRIYYAAPGKLDDLNARFRNHTLKLFEKHGFQNIGYWMPLENPENKLIYILASPSREAHGQAWKSFGADPAWKEVVKTTEANGRLVTKAEVIYLKPTEFSPISKPSSGGAERCFELRTYAASAGNLNNLLARFRDHTLRLFEKYGITNVGYWTPADKDKGADDTLIYLLAHKSKDAAAESFKNFRADPAWVDAKKASEVNGSLTTKVESVFMAPTDYSPMK